MPDFTTAMALVRRNVAIGCVPAHVAKSMGGEGVVTRAVRDEKHSTRLFLAWRTEGLGDVARWCIDYLSRPSIKAWLCGELPDEDAR